MIEQYEHQYSQGKSAKVFVQSHLKGRHREHCLCYQNCKFFLPTVREENCPIANVVFAVCVDYDLVLPVWECPKYAAREAI